MVIMECLIESIVKKIGLSSNQLLKKFGLSSNQLLKCVLLNTAIELFSYNDASAYSGAGCLYHDWGMEDFDHLYSAALEKGQTLKNSDICLPSCPSDWITDQACANHSPPVTDTVFVESVDELETMQLPIPENIYVKAGHVNDRLDSNQLNNKLDKPESFYYLVGPVNLWLELPLDLDMQVILGPESAANGLCAEDYLLCCSVQELSFLNASPGLGSAKIQELVQNDCGVQSNEELPAANTDKTLNDSQRESFSAFNQGTDAKSILWDSYDLHSSRSLADISMLEMSWSLGSDDDGFTLLEEEMVLLSQQDLDNVLHTVSNSVRSADGETFPHKITSKCLGKQPPSSTPCVERRKVLEGELRRTEELQGLGAAT